MSTQLEHSKDSDCTVDPATGLCTECGVMHGDPCPDCDGRGFHQYECVAICGCLKVNPSGCKPPISDVRNPALGYHILWRVWKYLLHHSQVDGHRQAMDTISALEKAIVDDPNTDQFQIMLVQQIREWDDYRLVPER